MKVLTIRRLMLVLGLTIGLMVLWSAAAPKAEGTGSLFGGWYPMEGLNCCDWIFPNDVCPNGTYWNGHLMYCQGIYDNYVDTCILAANPPTEETCDAIGDYECQPGPPTYEPLCWIHDAECKIH